MRDSVYRGCNSVISIVSSDRRGSGNLTSRVVGENPRWPMQGGIDALSVVSCQAVVAVGSTGLAVRHDACGRDRRHVRAGVGCGASSRQLLPSNPRKRTADLQGPLAVASGSMWSARHARTSCCLDAQSSACYAVPVYSSPPVLLTHSCTLVASAGICCAHAGAARLRGPERLLTDHGHLSQALCTVVNGQPPFGYGGQAASPSKGALILGEHGKNWLSL